MTPISNQYQFAPNIKQLEEEEFEFLQNKALQTIQRLGYYSQTDEIELFVDASPIGLGAVLVQFNESKVQRVIACASKALTPTEQRYPHTQKEALAVVWGVERFSSYLLSRSFIVRTDAEANEFIFNTSHRLGRRAISRAEAWALRLQPYDYTIKRVSGGKNVADALSRLITETQEAIPFEEDNENHFLYSLDAGCMEVTWEQVEGHSERDIELQKLREAIVSNKLPEELRRFEALTKNLSFLGFLIFKDNRVVLPRSLRSRAMASAHGGHVGEVAMKRIMREFFWWPGMATEVEAFVKACQTCAVLARKNPPIPLSSRELPDGPWEIIQIDFLSIPSFGSGEFLVIVDTYSRYLYVVEMRHTDADSTNAALCDVFKLWGCPIVIQSDNGPPFQSSTFIAFWEAKGVKIRKSIPLSPQSNGTVERQNQGIIKAVSASKIDGVNWRSALQQYVHKHNCLVPHSRLNVTPFELLVGWKFRGTFPSLWSSAGRKTLDRCELRDRDAETKLTSKRYADASRGAKVSDLKIGDIVLLAQLRKCKTDPTFSAERYRIIARDGAKVVVLSKNGIQYARNVQEVKRAPEQTQEMLEPEPHKTSAPSLLSTGEGLVELPDNTESLQGTEILSSSELLPNGIDTRCSTRRILRPRGVIRKPERFDNNFTYNIFY